MRHCEATENNKRRREALARGDCRQCGKRPYATGRTRCDECLVGHRERMAKVRAARTDAGLCRGCGYGSQIGKARLCVACHFSAASRCTTRSKVSATELMNLMARQEYRCAITGDEIKIGINAHLDHIVPKTRGGVDSIDNLQWTRADVNMIKRDLLMEEFIELCSKIHNRKTLNGLASATPEASHG